MQTLDNAAIPSAPVTLPQAGLFSVLARGTLALVPFLSLAAMFVAL